MPDVFEMTIVPGAAHRVDAREQRALDVEPLDDRFDDPVDVARAARGRVSKPPVVISAAASGVKNGSGFSVARALQALARGVGA